MGAASLVLALLAGQHPPAVDPVRVEAAIRKGADYLKSLEGFGRKKSRRDELVLLTLVHAGLPDGDPTVRKLLETVLGTSLERTYNVALQAMILEEVQRVKHQGRIRRCAQFLVDNQCPNGQWSYGTPTLYVEDLPVETAGRKEVASAGRARPKGEPPPPGFREKPRVLQKLRVEQKRESEKSSGDNSNSQYAALGLRACHDAGILIPPAVIERARKWWADSQHDGKDRHEGYPARGWSYDDKADFHPYGSMTAGAVGGQVIYDHILGKPWKTDPVVRDGLAWMARNFSVVENPGPPEKHGEGLNHYYYLYALERVGVLYGTERIGGHAWYPAGAEVLLGAQKADGSWKSDEAISDTCYAILFLRRATRPLMDVASQDRLRPVR